MSTRERTVTIPITSAVTFTIESLAPAAPADDFAAAAETAISRVLNHVEAEVRAIEVGEGTVEVRWSSALDALQCAQRVLPLLEQGRVGEAALLMEVLRASDPENVTLLANLGMVYSDQGFLEEAIVLLEEAVTLDPSHADGFVALGVACTRKGDLPGATEHLVHATDLQPQNPWAFRNLGAVYLKRDMPAEALGALTVATELSPEDERAWFGLAEALQQSGDTSRADDAYQRVIALNEYGEMAEMARQARSKIATGTFRKTPGDVRMDAVMYLLSALERFQHMETAQLQKIGFEIAMLGTQGININDPESRYTIETLPGEFSGLSLVCHQYAAFKRFAPEMDIGIDLSREYEAAREMFGRQDDERG
jgi:tetratricopeptide (TPR) repeat protein